MYKKSSEYDPNRFYTASKCKDNEPKLNKYNKKHLDNLKLGGVI